MNALRLASPCLALLLAAALLFAPVSAETPEFSDVPETHWAREAVTALSERGLLVGVGGGRFAPDALMTRAQFLTLLLRALSAALPEAAADEPWYAPALARAEELRLTDCFLSADAEAQDGAVERCEAAALLMQCMILRGEAMQAAEAVSYADSADIPARYAAAIAAVRCAGLMGGYPDGSFRPHGTLTRAEAAAVVLRLVSEQARLGPGGETVPFENFYFLGDSMLANPHAIGHIFSRHGHQALVCGGATIRQFYGVTTGGVYVGVEQWGAVTGTLAGKDFNGVVLLVGANDLGGAGPEEVCARLEVLLTELNDNLTQPVFVLELFPVNQWYQSRCAIPIAERNAQVARVNAWLREFCAARPGLWCVDATEGFVGENGELIHSTDDGIHMHTAWYDFFYENIERGIRATGAVR